MRIPIFITIFDKLEVLKMSIQSYYDNIKIPFEIIIHDNGTTYQPTLDYVKTCGFKYYKSSNDPNAVKESIKDWYKTNDSPYYIVTDPDISLEGVNNDILEVFMYILELRKELTCVGTALRIDDLPDHYPLKERVINWESQFWKKQDKHTIQWKDKTQIYYNSIIDSTFAMYRKSFTFSKLNKNVIRVAKPYAAKHLDWYIDPNKLTEDQIYYMKTTNERGHWGVNLLREKIN